MKGKKIAGWLLAGVVAASCTEVKLEPLPDKSDVRVHLDWTEYDPQAQMKFHFYRTETGETTETETDGTKYEGQLKYGMYRMLAYNPQASHISFSHTERYETAAATAGTAPEQAVTRTGNLTLLEEPGILYAGTTEELEVPRLDPAEITTAPKPLTRSLTLTFDLTEASGVNEIEGTFNGLYASVLLATGKPTQEAESNAPQTATRFTINVTGQKVTTEVRLLGILNPQGGNAYQSTLHLQLKGNDGWQQETTADLTRVLTDILSKGEGALNIEVKEEIRIEVKSTRTELWASVKAWEQHGEGDGEVYYYY